jgi:hypothetical protein
VKAGPFWVLTGVVTFLLGAPGLLLAQGPGEAEVAAQSYAFGGSGQTLTNTSGVSANGSQVFSGLGLFTASLEGYGSNGFRTGTIFGSLQGVPIYGRHWDFVGGDFHVSSNLVENPFLNIYAPDISARGVRVSVKRATLTYQVFAGAESLAAGARIPFRVMLPQRVLGASVQQAVGAQWTVGARILNLSTPSRALATNPTLFGPSRDFNNSNSLLFQSSYAVTPHLKLFTEASYATASTFTSVSMRTQPASVLFGPSWESERVSLHANYVRQGAAYLPLLGYFVGDRKGPYADVHYRATKRVELYGSTSAYSNNLEHNQAASTFHSTGYNAGGSVSLPWLLTAGASLSSLHLMEHNPSRPDDTRSNNRQVSASLSRPIGRHGLRGSLIDMALDTNGVPHRERLIEAGDTFTWKRLVVGGAVRTQHSQSTTETRNTVFLRGSLSASFKHVSAYGSFEKGDDLVNTSVFSTSSFSSTVVGLSAPLASGWSAHLEAFRNRLNTALNPQNLFLFGASGLSLGTQLATSNQWSVYLRIGKEIHWGKGVLGGNSIEQYAALRAPLMGSVQGLVIEHALEGPRPVDHVTVSLDGERGTVTDASGRYQFVDVPEGAHEVRLDLEQLPADYDPGPASEARLRVEPRGIAHADFSVVSLTQLVGSISAPAGVPLDTIVIRLKGTNRYTTPDANGRFAFSNLREGEYDVILDEHTLPDGCLAASPVALRVQATNAHVEIVGFELRDKPQEAKPVREVIQEPIRIGKLGK